MDIAGYSLPATEGVPRFFPFPGRGAEWRKASMPGCIVELHFQERQGYGERLPEPGPTALDEPERRID